MKRPREPDDHDSPHSDFGAGWNARRSPDPDSAQRPFAKFAELDSADADVTMRCFLPPHKEPLVFKTYAEYEAHYNSFHTNRCVECRKNFPSEHLLGVHIEEFHDSLIVVRREKGEHTVS